MYLINKDFVELDSGLGSITGRDISSAKYLLLKACGLLHVFKPCATPVRRQAGRKYWSWESGVLTELRAAAEPLETTLPWHQWRFLLLLLTAQKSEVWPGRALQSFDFYLEVGRQKLHFPLCLHLAQRERELVSPVLVGGQLGRTLLSFHLRELSSSSIRNCQGRWQCP